MDKEQMKLPPQPHEFRSKPAWQRLIIMIGGVVVNVILAIVIFIFIAWKWGDEYVPVSNMKYGLYADSLGRKIGLQDGDVIVAVGDKQIQKVGQATIEMLQQVPKEITVRRGEQLIKVKIPEGFISQLNKNHGEGFTYLRTPLIVDSIEGKIKLKGDAIKKGDTLIAFDGKPVRYSIDLNQIKTDSIKDKYVNLSFKRNADTINTSVYFDKEGKSYLDYQSPADVFGSIKTTFTFSESITEGWKKCWETLGKYTQGLKQLFASKEIKVNDSLGSVFSIGNAFSGNLSDWKGFWTLTGVFSIILAFMNILPIPALDGGHALFTIVEIISGRKPSDKFMEYAQMVGMVLLLGLMAYAMGLDIFRMFK